MPNYDPTGNCDVIALIHGLSKYKYSVGDELAVQDGIESALKRMSCTYAREYVLTAADRPDFLLPGGVVIEIKVKGSAAACLRQVARYAKHADVREILVLGTPAWIDRLPPVIDGKPLHNLRLINSVF